MIEDRELRDIFKTESAERLQRLGEDLSRLEENPGEAEALEAAFREAHSLKGAARALGVHDIEILAHRVEDILGAARKGSAALAPAAIERLRESANDLRSLVHAALTGEMAQVTLGSALAQLSGEGAAPLPPAGEKAQRSILLVEDSEAMQKLGKLILESAGYRVTVAADGAEALAKLDSQAFDAVVSDIMMPNMDGIELTEKIRRNEKYTGLPVILVTALENGREREAGLKAGASACIAKPSSDRQAFLAALEKWV